MWPGVERRWVRVPAKDQLYTSGGGEGVGEMRVRERSEDRRGMFQNSKNLIDGSRDDSRCIWISSSKESM